jgi:antitoxin HigA-1
MTAKKLPPIHPGEILLEEFLRPMGITSYRLARAIKVDPRRIHAIIHGERSISPQTALRLSKFFGMSEQFWMNLQTRYDLEVEKDLHGAELQEIEELEHKTA